MKVVGAFEAKNRLGQSLDLSERGEEVTITRHGKLSLASSPPSRQRNEETRKRRFAASSNAPRRQNSADSIEPNGRPIATMAGRERGSRQFRHTL